MRTGEKKGKEEKIEDQITKKNKTTRILFSTVVHVLFFFCHATASTEKTGAIPLQNCPRIMFWGIAIGLISTILRAAWCL